MHKILTTIRLTAILLFGFTAWQGIGQGYYHPTTISSLAITFENEDWAAVLHDYYSNGLGEELLANCIIDGVSYSDVGVAYQPYLNYESGAPKNPLVLHLDKIHEGQTHHGYTTLKLSNEADDPSFIRQTLAYQIGRNYMDLPLANFVQVTINGSAYGLMATTENIDRSYLSRRLFIDEDNIRFIAAPQNEGAEPANLDYAGPDSTYYFNSYEKKSALGWGELEELILTLITDISEIEEVLDVDRTLWMLAFDNVMANLGNYSAISSQKYDLIQDNSGVFFPIPWSLTHTFGSLSQFEGTALPYASVSELGNLDLFLYADNADFPLIKQLLSRPHYKKAYLAHVKTIYTEQLLSGNLNTQASALQLIISDNVLEDDQKLYSFTHFEENLNISVPHISLTTEVTGLLEVMDLRTDFLATHPALTVTAPEITSIVPNPIQPSAYETVQFKVSVSDANLVELHYRDERGVQFEKITLLDDGLHGDEASGDGIYGGELTLSAKDLQYYIYAENDAIGAFAPQRAAHEYYHLSISSDVVINEIIAKNNSTGTDEEGKYEDWIELYNTTDEVIDISGFYLSDKPNSDPYRYKLPSGTNIAANDYLIVFMDADTLDEGLHANFKLNADGETVSLSNSDGFELSRVTYPKMGGSTSYGRYPNGTGPFMRMVPTFMAENSFSALNTPKFKDENALLVYPNPANSQVTINLEQADFITIYTMAGTLVYASENAVTSTNISDRSMAERTIYC
jgi:hypothetical protein